MAGWKLEGRRRLPPNSEAQLLLEDREARARLISPKVPQLVNESLNFDQYSRPLLGRSWNDPGAAWADSLALQGCLGDPSTPKNLESKLFLKAFEEKYFQYFGGLGVPLGPILAPLEPILAPKWPPKMAPKIARSWPQN